MRRFLRIFGLVLLYGCVTALFLSLCVVDAVPEERLTVFLMCIIVELWGAIAGGFIAVEAEK